MSVTAMMTGHCNFPATEMVVRGQVVPAPKMHSHEKCQSIGAGAMTPSGFLPCPCGCHLEDDEYRCDPSNGGCGKMLRVAPHWPNDYQQGDKNADPDEVVYVHIDPDTGRATGEWC